MTFPHTLSGEHYVKLTCRGRLGQEKFEFSQLIEQEFWVAPGNQAVCWNDLSRTVADELLKRVNPTYTVELPAPGDLA